MSIERRIISSLQSALHAGPLLPGEELDTPYVISSLDGRLMDCNSIFYDLVAKDDLKGTHYRERCPTDEIEEITNQIFASINMFGFSKSQRLLLAYDGKVHDVSYERQLVGIAGCAFVLASLTVERFDIGKVSRRSNAKIVFLKEKFSVEH